MPTGDIPVYRRVKHRSRARPGPRHLSRGFGKPACYTAVEAAQSSCGEMSERLKEHAWKLSGLGTTDSYRRRPTRAIRATCRQRCSLGSTPYHPVFLAISEFPKGRKYLISLSFRGKASVRPAQVGGFDVNIVIHGSTAVRGRGDLVAYRWALWKLTAPWTHRTRPPHLGKRCAFSTSSTGPFPSNHSRKTPKGPKIALGNPDRPVFLDCQPRLRHNPPATRRRPLAGAGSPQSGPEGSRQVPE